MAGTLVTSPAFHCIESKAPFDDRSVVMAASFKAKASKSQAAWNWGVGPPHSQTQA